jgi:eukaryotic-like serine/threonine-protein kinase
MTENSERTIFLEAIEIGDLQAMRDYVQKSCAGNPELEKRVGDLVSAHLKSEGVLDQPLFANAPNNLAITRNQSSAIVSSGGTVEPLQQIGPYRLMEQIGEGGFGVVYVAQQEQPVRRKVALKMVKPNMSSRDVMARFEAERQALALMDHPGIARVFDAGVTSDGRPYFVMELVRGVSITEFCDAAKLDVVKRLDLFRDICFAVHHAHQKGIIHRDLKPSNVLTTLLDDKPTIKVIDFGIAKAIGQDLTDKTIYTRFMSMMGTPQYMSPEQAEMNSLDIDTRSDIYSLGVILYELLTGTTPIEQSRMSSAGYHEIRRMIVEEEPPRPSMRLSTLGNRLTTVSSSRNVEPRRLRSMVDGDLDWIVMKAMEKDRQRRYDSAASMAKDIEAYLHDEPIDARPPSRWYQFRKFAARNRVALLTTGLVASSLVAGTAASLYQMSMAISALHDKDSALAEAIKAKEEERAAKKQLEQFSQNLVQANQLLSSAQTHFFENELNDSLADLQNAIDLQPSYYLSWLQRGQTYSRLGMWKSSASDFAKALELGAPTDQPQWLGIGALFLATNHPDAYRTLEADLSDNLNKSNDAVDWQALRALAITPDHDIAINWDKVAMQVEKTLQQPATPFDRFPRGRGRPNDRPGERSGDPFEPPPHDDRLLPSNFDERERHLFENQPSRGENPQTKAPNGGRFQGQLFFVPSLFGQPLFGQPPDDHPPRDGNERRGFQRPQRDERDHGPGPNDRLIGEGGPMRLPLGVKRYIAALAMLRAEKYPRAIELLQQAKADQGWGGVFLLNAPLAIAHYNLGENEKADAEFKEATANLNAFAEQLTQNDRRRNNIAPWFDTIESFVLYQEAARLMNKPPLNIEELLDNAERQAIEQSGLEL